jgi:uncharacterized protein (DUF2147 family)
MPNAAGGATTSVTESWVGRLYNRQNGKTYDSEITMPAPDQMSVRAYVLLPIIAKTQVWRRQP